VDDHGSRKDAMTSYPTIVLALCVGVMGIRPLAEAGITDVYFSKVGKIGGQIYRTPNDLPGPTKVLETGKDRVVFLYVVFSDLDAHTLRGDLKAADDKVVRQMRRTISPVTRAGIRWRSITEEFSLEGLGPGEYSIDLVVDDTKTGTYSFTLR
jgi:hypothetical protein